MSGVKQWVVPIMGFTENNGRSTGMDALWRSIRKFDNGSTIAICDPWEWNEDSKANALWIVRNSSYLPRILIVAYSWGAGWGFVNLAMELQKLGQEVEVAILCDPVFRSPWKFLAPLALTRFPLIAVPENVQRVAWVRQRMNLPMAHDLMPLGSDRQTFIEPPVTLNYPHAKIDNSPEFQSLAYREVERFCTAHPGGWQIGLDKDHGDEVLIRSSSAICFPAPLNSLYSGGPVS